MTAKSAETQILAIDGGGTRCRFALAHKTNPGEDHVVVEGGPANATTDFHATVRCITEGLEALAQRAELQADALYDMPAFVGLAGVTGQTIADRLQAALPLRNVQYTEDRVAALRGAFGTANGLIAHCGTGSFFATQFKGAHRFAGGWGSLLGDEASAQWVGRRALSAALQQTDGFLPASPLIESLRDRFASTEEILEFAQTATPQDFGELAPIVTRHAQNRDSNAQQIMRAAAVYVAHGIEQMDWKPPMPICLTGGIGPQYEPYLAEPIRTYLARPIGTPLDGAIAIARSRTRVADGHC